MATALFLDVKGALSSLDPNTLCHKLRRTGIPENYVEAIKLTLTGKKTGLTFDEYTSDLIHIKSGLDQGDPSLC